MPEPLDDDELLIRAYFRNNAGGANDVLRPADFERRRKPERKRDENGISTFRLRILGETKIRAKFKDSLSYVGFAAISVKQLREQVFVLEADSEGHVSVFCFACDRKSLPEICEAQKGMECILRRSTTLRHRQTLASSSKVMWATTTDKRRK